MPRIPLQGHPDRLFHQIELHQRFSIGEAQHAKSIGCEPRIARSVVLHLLRVLRAVNLDDESLLSAPEVDDVGSEWHLPPELVAFEAPLSERPPEAAFGIGRIAPEFSCAGDEIHVPSPTPITRAGETPTLTLPRKG